MGKLGHRLIKSKPGLYGGELDEGEIVLGVFFEARGDGAEVLDLVEEARDDVAVAIEERAQAGRVFPTRDRLDAGPCTSRFQALAQGIGVIGPVGQQACRLPIASSMSAALRPSWA